MESNIDCNGYYHYFHKIPKLPILWHNMCYKCIAIQIQKWKEEIKLGKKFKIDHGNYETLIRKASRILKEFYQKNPDLALEN